MYTDPSGGVIYTDLDDRFVRRAVYTDLGEVVGLLCCALRLASWVAEGEDNGVVVEGGHVLQDVFCEGSRHCGRSCGLIR